MIVLNSASFSSKARESLNKSEVILMIALVNLSHEYDGTFEWSSLSASPGRGGCTFHLDL